MTGFRVERKPNGIRIWEGGTERVFLEQDDCNKLARMIWEAQRKYWNREGVV